MHFDTIREAVWNVLILLMIVLVVVIQVNNLPAIYLNCKEIRGFIGSYWQKHIMMWSFFCSLDIMM
jgi:hypothetical protein